jgi:hypothetical protein
MNRRLQCFAMMLPFSLTVAGCMLDSQTPATSSVTLGAAPYGRGALGTLTYRAVDLLLAGAPEVTPTTPLLVGSISDAQHVDHTSTLGNIVSDMIRTRIAQDGHTTQEIRLRSAVAFNQGEGEFLFSRNRRALMAPANAAAIVTGTYAVGSEMLYISLKLVSATDARIISGADFVVPLTDVVGMLPHDT